MIVVLRAGCQKATMVQARKLLPAPLQPMKNGEQPPPARMVWPRLKPGNFSLKLCESVVCWSTFLVRSAENCQDLPRRSCFVDREAVG